MDFSVFSPRHLSSPSMSFASFLWRNNNHSLSLAIIYFKLHKLCLATLYLPVLLQFFPWLYNNLYHQFIYFQNSFCICSRFLFFHAIPAVLLLMVSFLSFQSYWCLSIKDAQNFLMHSSRLYTLWWFFIPSHFISYKSNTHREYAHLFLLWMIS